MSMEIKPDRMISLGYGKYWRSDAIVGLTPIEEDRGPGRRTEVYTATIDDPIIASRSEEAILRDMAAASDQHLQMQEVREMLADMLDALEDIPDVVRRLLLAEARFDVAAWQHRLHGLLKEDGAESSVDQNDLFD
jgi:hypothetical protein